MRAVRRPRQYVARRWLILLRPLLRFSTTRDAYVLRVVGGDLGPVLRIDRRHVKRRSHVDGVERRRARAA